MNNEHDPDGLNINKLEFKEAGNNASFIAISRKPKTLDEHLEDYKVDLSIWKVDKWLANQWEMATARAVEGTVVSIPIYQTKAWLSKIRLEAVKFPEVQPVHISILDLAQPVPRSMEEGVKIGLIISDIQTGFKRDLRTGRLDPFHNRQALSIAVQVAEYLQPDRIVFNGDNLDLNEWSDKFIRSPEFYFTTQPAIAEIGWWYGQFRRACPTSKIDHIDGNHESRMLKAIVNHNVASYDLRPADDLSGHAVMSIQRLLGLDGLDISYNGPYPFGEVWLNDNFRIVHGEVVRGKSGKTVAAIVEDARHSENQGHIHRVEIASKTVWTRKGPKTYMATSFGTMARIDPGVVPGAKSRQNWQTGFGIIEYEEGNGLYNVRPVLIFGGSTIYDGRRWEGEEEESIIERIESDLKVIKVH